LVIAIISAADRRGEYATKPGRTIHGLTSVEGKVQPLGHRRKRGSRARGEPIFAVAGSAHPRTEACANLSESETFVVVDERRDWRAVARILLVRSP
jgi:hypothetical protein